MFHHNSSRKNRGSKLFHPVILSIPFIPILVGLSSVKAEAANSSPTHVVFFGGFGSTSAQMKMWATASASVAASAALDYDFYAAPINSTHSDKTNVVADNSKSIALWVQKITQTPNENFILVGHSSGSAISNAIAAQVKSRAVPLIVLDGFIPTSSAQTNGECWSTVDAQDSRKTSLNTSAMRTCKHYREVKVPGCQTSMCLHFSLVNRAAPSIGITSSNYKTAGYLRLNPFLDWL